MSPDVYADRLRGLLAHIEGNESPDFSSLVKVARDCERIRQSAKIRPDITTAAIEIRVLTRPNEVAVLAKELGRSVSSEVVGTIKTAVVLFYNDPDLKERVCRPVQWTREDGTTLAIGAKRGRVTAIEAIHRWIRIAELAAAAVSDATPTTTPSRSKRDKARKRWLVPEIDEHIREALNCGDAETEEKYLFASADELENMIGCNRKTAMETTFWVKHRDEKQKAWRLKNTKGKHPRKRDI